MKFKNFKIENYHVVNGIRKYGELTCIDFSENRGSNWKKLFLNKDYEIVAEFDRTLIPDFENVFTWCIYPLNNKNDGIFVIEREYRDKTKISSLVKVKKDLSYKILGEYDEIKQSDRDNCFKVKKGKLNGLINCDTELENMVVIECKYPVLIADNDAIHVKKENGIEDDTFAIRKNGLYGFIDYNGNEFIKPQYEEYHAFHLGIACVKKNGKWGFINKQNETVIPFIYDMDYNFYYYPKMYNDKLLIPVALNGKFGIIDIENNVVIPFEYENIYCCGNYFMAQKSGKIGVININQNIILPFEYSEGEGDAGEGSYHLIAKDGLTGLLDNDMNFIVPCNYKELIVNLNSIVAKKQNDKYILLDFKGEVVSREFDKIDDYSSEGLYHAGIGKKYGYIDDKTGEIVIPFKYNRILNDFMGGIAESELPDFSVDIIDKKGNVLYHTKGYKEVYNLGNGCILAQNENHEFEIVRLV